jgi:hypothetical protein
MPLAEHIPMSAPKGAAILPTAAVAPPQAVEDRKISFEDVSDAIVEEVWEAIMGDDGLRASFREVWEAVMDANREMLEQNRRLKELLRDTVGGVTTQVHTSFISRLEQQVKGLGFKVDRSSQRVLFNSGDYSALVGVDVFLENNKDVLAVMVKPRWYIDDDTNYREEKTVATIEDIRDQVRRMGPLRRYFERHGDRRRLYGAVAAAVFPEDVLSLALRMGLYVIEDGEDRVGVKAPEGGAKAWQVG